jgi:hypothetical protein
MKPLFLRYLSIIFAAVLGAGCLQVRASENTIQNADDFGARPYAVGDILYEDSFDDPNLWVIEQMPGGSAVFINNMLDVRDKAGATIWLRRRLASPVIIEYEVTVNGDERVSDMNCFWMATDASGSSPFEPDKTAKSKRSGSFGQYNSLKLYYVGCGGHNNTKTRFRRYDGAGDKPLKEEHDLSDQKYLLKPDRTYTIQLVAWGNRIQYFRDGICFYDVIDTEPLTSGWFAFRVFKSHQTMKNFRVHKLNEDVDDR